MKNTIKKKLAATAVALALSTAGSAMAATTLIDFDPTGTGTTTTQVDLFDWQPQTILLDGLGGNLAINSAFTLLTQGRIGTISNTNTSTTIFADGIGLGAGREFTFELSVPMRLIGAATATTFVAGRDPFSGPAALTATNFFRIFADTTRDSDTTSGAGYSGGTSTLIAEGFVRAAPFNFTATGSSPVLDALGTDNYPGISSMLGNGGSSFVIDLTFKDSNYFISNVLGLTTDMSGAGGANLAFNQVNPSATVAGLGWNVGGDNRNDFDCGTGAPCDMVFQSDYSSSFSDSEIPVPVPGSLALLGLGLGLMGGVIRRRRNKQA